MKKLSILATAPLAVAALGLAAYSAPAYAAGATTINQTDVAAALADLDGEAHNGVKCLTGDICTLAAGEYALGGDLNFGSSGLLINSNSTVDLSDKTITSDNTDLGTVYVRDASVTLKNGAINNSQNFGTVLGASNDTGSTNLTLDGITFATEKQVQLGTGTVTMANVTAPVQITAEGTTLTIDSGTYGNPLGIGSINLNGETTAVINGGTFVGGGGASAINLLSAGGKAPALTVNSGTFTSEGDSGILVEDYKSVTINGGTFTGAATGLGFLVYHGDITLAGGTYKAAGSTGMGGTDPIGAITFIDTTDTNIANLILAANHSYTNSHTFVSEYDVLVIGDNETSVVSGATSSAATADDSSINAPKSGVMTTEAGSAAASLAPAAVIALGGATAFALAKAKKED